jgi:hypothetical protein
MKNITIVVLLAVSIALGALTIHQKNQLAQMQTQLASVQNQLKKKSEADEKTMFAESRAKMLQNALTETAAAAGEQSKQVAQLQKSLVATKTNGANPFGEMSKMFKDPKMKEMIKSSQKMFMGPMIDKQYAALFQQLNMTPEQAATLKDLLQKKMLAGADAGMSMMDGSLDAAQRADLTKQIKSATDDYDAQIKQFLGDENYPAFQGYEKTVPDRMTVSQFSDQLAGGASPLSNDQQQQLAVAMNDARTSFKWTTDYNNKNPSSGDYASMFSEDKINQFTSEKEQFDQQFLTRAQQILTPEQATAFQQFQTAQRGLQIMGMKMAANMFAPKSQ